MTAAGATVGGTRRAGARELVAGIATIMTKELRSRMRGRRAFVVLTVYLSILALLTYAVYLVVSPSAQGNMGVGLGQANASALTGQAIFAALSFFQLILVCFIAPAVTAGQVSLEREKQTLDLLVSTPMRPAAIVLGKLGAALAFVVLMIVAAIPISAIVLMYGGAGVDDIVRQQLVLLATAVALGTVGLFFSALLKRTQAATVLTYITMLVLTLGTAVVFFFWTMIATQSQGGFDGPRPAPEQLLYLNPGIAMLDVVAYAEPGGGNGMAAFLGELRGEQTGVLEPQGAPGPEECFSTPDGGMVCEQGPGRPVDMPLGGPGPAVEEPRSAEPGHWWPRIALTFLVLSAVLAALSMRLVIPAGMRWAFRRAGRADRAAPSPADPPPSVDEAAR